MSKGGFLINARINKINRCSPAETNLNGRLCNLSISSNAIQPVACSINSGVINGTIHEIQASIEAYQQKYETLQIILCGGDSIFFDTHLKSSIFVEPELVLIGLNTIVNQQNESN